MALRNVVNMISNVKVVALETKFSTVVLYVILYRIACDILYDSVMMLIITTVSYNPHNRRKEKII